MSAAALAKQLHGQAAGPGRWLCRCPMPSHGKGEGDRRPSLIVSDTAHLSDSISVHCLAGCSWEDVKAELRRRGLLDERAEPRQSSPSPDFGPAPEPEPDEEALRLWRAAAPIDGTLAERYLRQHRRLSGPLPPSLRYLPTVTYRGTGHSFPAMIAALARPDRKIVAAQVTFLRPSDGSKAPIARPRDNVGKLGTGAIRLGPAGEVLGLAEGVETALSAMQLSGLPCWASLGGQRLAKVTIPETVREVHVFGDGDEPGRLAAEVAADRFTREGRRVLLRYPPEGLNDWNDALLMRAGRAAA